IQRIGANTMAGTLQNKVILVTGGGSGIGRATAQLIAKEGAKVMIADYVPEGAERTVKMIKEAGGEATCLAADVSVTKQVEGMIAKTVETYGGLDCAFNNAGIEGTIGDTAACTEDNFDRVVAIDLKAVWLCMKYEIPQMLKQGGGAIVNTASISAVIGNARAAAYNASKAGVALLTKSVAVDFAAAGIRANCVCPGAILTPANIAQIESGSRPIDVYATLIGQHPIGRLGTAEEVAAAVLFLASDDASFITGASLMVDGGYTAI
ncbi:MAG: glucose 1-dehydrogenase, partial [bacterium]